MGATREKIAFTASGADTAQRGVAALKARYGDCPMDQADVIVAAVGRAEFVKGEWVKPGAIVLDAGYNEGNVGDVDYDGAFKNASLITPVPGGVGPMTIATLIDQTGDAALVQHGINTP